MAKGEFDMLYLCAGGWGGGAMIFSSDKLTSLEGAQKKKPEIIKGGLQKNERKKMRESS